MTLSLFAATLPGLGPFAAQELWELGAANVKSVPGGVEFRGTPRDLYRANLHARTPSRILVRVGGFTATAFYDLRRKASRLEWERYLAPGQPVAIKATCHKSKLYHSEAVAQRVAGAIGDRLGSTMAHHKGNDEADSLSAAQLLLVRLDHDRCTISVDSSGELLHRRGYRLATAKAPLRETLAAGVLMASGWDKTSPLIDPFCGSGTIPIEAALMARNVAPGRARRFAFMDWPGSDPVVWESLLAEAGAGVKDARPIILASDRDAGAIESARANAERAGVAHLIEFSRRAVSGIEPPPTRGWIVTNPPYGVRLSEDQDVRNLYARFGSVIRAKCPGWRVAMLTGHLQLQRAVGLSFDEGVALVNGGLRVRLFRAAVE